MMLLRMAKEPTMVSRRMLGMSTRVGMLVTNLKMYLPAMMPMMTMKMFTTKNEVMKA